MGVMGFERFQFINAPLKSLPFKALNQAINNANGKSQSGYAKTLTPYLANKVAFVRTGALNVSTLRKRGSVVQFHVDSYGQYAPARFMNVIGGIAPTAGAISPDAMNVPPEPRTFRDIVVLFKYTTVAELYPSEQYKYLQPILFNRNSNNDFRVYRTNPQASSGLVMLLDGKYTQTEGAQSWECKANEVQIDPNKWLVLTDMRFFDISDDGEMPRQQVGLNTTGSPLSYDTSTFAACFSMGSIQAGGAEAYDIVNTGAADGIISLQPVTGNINITGVSDYFYFTMLVGAPIYSARCEYILGDDNTCDWVHSFSKYVPDTMSRGYTTILAANRNDTRIKIEGENTAAEFFDTERRRLVYQGAAYSSHAFLDITNLYFNDDKSKSPRLIFNGVDSIINFFADWGLAATDDENKAKTMDSGLLVDGFVPDGGEVTGFDTNATPDIPSYPDNTSDIIERAPPQISALSAANLYALTVTQCKDLFDFMMTDSYVRNISELFNDKLSAVNSLKLFPFDLYKHDEIHAVPQTALNIGNVQADISNSAIIDNYNTWIFGGSITQLAYYGNYNDYINTSYSIYIPFCGIVDLPADRVVNCKLDLYYAVDLLTGSGTAVLYSDDVIFKTVPAQMGIDIPITFTNANQQAINATLATLNIASSLGGSISQTVASGSPLPLVSGIAEGAINGFSAVASNPNKTGTVGGIGSNTGYTLPQQPFLIIVRNKIAIPDSYEKTLGKPSVFGGAVSQYLGSGFISVKNVKLQTSATESERAEILGLLSSGIFV